jgi:heme/copper-type cytochrome/quinol oxidase subunit 1
MSSTLIGAILMFLSGLIFLVASVFLRRSDTPSVDICLHATYIVIGHFHLLLLSSLALWVYAGLYYVGARLLGLHFNNWLVLGHLGVTLVALIGLNSVPYLKVARSTESPVHPYFLRVGFLSLGLFLMSIVVFFVIFLLSSGEKLWRIST